MNKVREIVSERPMSSARAFHILTVRVKKDVWYVVVLHFLGTNRFTVNVRVCIGRIRR